MTAPSILFIGLSLLSGFSGLERDHDIVPDDYFSLDHIGACAVSPRGERVAFTLLRWDRELDRRNTDVWVVERATQAVQRVTFDAATEHDMVWDASGRTMYFLADYRRAGETTPPYDGTSQVWRWTVGGELQAVTRVKDGVASYRLTADGKAVYYITGRKHVDEEWNSLRTEFADLAYAHGVTELSTLWRLDLGTWRTRQVVELDRVVRDWDVAADEARIAMVTTPDGNLVTHEGWSRVDVVDAATGAVTPVTPPGWRDDHPSPFGWVEGPRFAGDGAALAFTVSFDGHPTQVTVAEWTADQVSVRDVQRPAGVSVTGGTLQWRGPARELIMQGEHRARSRLYAVTEVVSGGQGPTAELTPGDVTVTGYGLSADGSHTVVISGGLDHAGDLFAVLPDGSYQRLTRVNPQIDRWKLPQISVVTWTGAGGAVVEGILELPPDHQPGQRLPMVVEIHGGPTAATWYRFRYWIYGRTLLPARGIAVLSPNYRGSTGYGDTFMVDLVGRENDIEVQDILAGVDAMVERGIADPERLGVMGWSNGGYLTNCLITTTDRFKAASSGAGVLDQVIQWGTEDTPGHVVNFMTGLPWERAEAYRDASPVYGLHRVRTPTLIHVGEHDARVPPAHARALYRALRHYVDVPTELIVYPGAGHGLTTYTHRKAKIAWDLAWFEKYLAPGSADRRDRTRPGGPGAR